MSFVFPVILLFLFGGISFYISRRVFQGLLQFFPGLHFGFVFGFFILMTLLMLLGFASSMLPFSAGIKHILNRIGMYWMGFFIYLLLFTLFADLLTVILRLCQLSFIQSPAFRAVRVICVVTLSLITVVYGLCHVNSIQHVSYEVKIENKTDISDMNIVLISDLHLGAIGSEDRLAQVVTEINAMDPDIVCIAGDFFDTDFTSIQNPQQAIQTLKQLSATYGIYACLGNHDAGQTTGQMQDFLSQCGIQLLNEDYAVIDNRLILVGRLDGTPIGGYGQLKRGQLSDFFTVDDPNLPVIVMDHNPANIDQYTDEIDLILSGHTHKGQLFPANLITGLIYDVDYGYYQKDATSPQVIVTSGVGYWGMPMRIGTDCEIVQLRLIP